MKLNKIQELVLDISQGKMIILMDDEDRENEGDLIIAAEKVTPKAINFMATHARGLICLALNQAKCNQLNLEPMVKNNGTQQNTAFTVSIEAAEGVTTGISAADRATTILAAVKKGASPKNIIQPGGSNMDNVVIETCNKYNINMIFTDNRLFFHYVALQIHLRLKVLMLRN